MAVFGQQHRGQKTASPSPCHDHARDDAQPRKFDGIAPGRGLAAGTRPRPRPSKSRQTAGMSEMADRYRKVAAEFTRRVEAVPADGWDRPAPCEGWVARDVVRHLVEWAPPMILDRWDIERPDIPSVDDDPPAAWRALDEAVQRALDDPEVAGRERETQMGTNTFENVTSMIFTSDVLVHTWDLARATGQDETLDADEVARMYAGMEPMEEAIRNSGHFGARVEVPADADPQTKLLAFTGRNPNWTP